MSNTRDFIDFSYKNISFSELGILRVSDGSRYSEDLLPPIQDKTVQVPGRDGAYYFGSAYGPRIINIPFAFDCLTEKDLRLLKRLLKDKTPGELELSEVPYKVYNAKITGSTVINYVPFTENGERIYKGEGRITFTCYEPYAHCAGSKKNLKNYSDSSEWNDSAFLINLDGTFDKIGVFDIMPEGPIMGCRVYNPGDKDSDWEIKIPFKENMTAENFKFQLVLLSEDDSGSGALSETERSNEFLSLGRCNAKTSVVNGETVYDSFITINTETRLVEGWINESQKSGNIYNEYLNGSSIFFKINSFVNDDLLLRTPYNFFLVETEDSDYANQNIELKYDYYYL